jgi:ADP-dependent NAD(P)H-hydrate dehydratase / NAD(P)H-hydrate epimerase
VLGRLLLAGDLPSLLPRRVGDAHKGSFGTVVLVAGSPETPGAALLAAAAALRSGAGLVRWATERDTLASVRALPPDLMLLVREPGEGPEPWAERVLGQASAVVVGPGLSTTPSRAADLAALLDRARVPLVIDADGLNLLAVDAGLLRRVQSPLVVTPHPKELSRLSGQSVDGIQHDRFAAALQFALVSGAVTVLKGAGTVIAEPDGAVTVAAVGNPGLATGGTGDVLAGLIGGLLAQGLEPAAAAQAGVLAHGAAGDLVVERVGQAGLMASDLPAALGEVWARHGR